MTPFDKLSALSAVFVFSVSAVWANDIPGPPCLPNESRAGTVFERSQQQNTSFIVHLTDADGHPIGPAAGIALPGTNIPGGGTVASLNVNQPGTPNNVNQPGACDAWNETILPNRGNGNGGNGVGGTGTGQPGSGLGGVGGTPTTPWSSLQIENYIFDPNQNVWRMYNIWTSVNQSIPNGSVLLLPDLYAADGSGLINQELYGLVNLDVLLGSAVCALNICQSPFSLGQTFTVAGGQVAGLPGMFFSTNPWTFTPAGGFVAPGGNYSGSAQVVTQHELPSVPEPGTLGLFGIGVLGLFGLKATLRTKWRSFRGRSTIRLR